MNKIYRNKSELIEKLIHHTDVVLDLGFWGQGVKIDDKNWVHGLLLKKAATVYGLDLEYDENWVHGLLLKKAATVYGLDLEYDEKRVSNPSHYMRGTAEDFDFPAKFDVIIAADLIEHLTNPGLFLDACARNLKPGGRLIITTPNCFNLFNIASKITKTDPIMNKDETCYFNHRSLRQLMRKKGWQVLEADYLYTLEVAFKESMRKRLLNVIYWTFSKFTPKFIETVVVVASPVGPPNAEP